MIHLVFHSVSEYNEHAVQRNYDGIALLNEKWKENSVCFSSSLSSFVSRSARNFSSQARADCS